MSLIISIVGKTLEKAVADAKLVIFMHNKVLDSIPCISNKREADQYLN